MVTASMPSQCVQAKLVIGVMFKIRCAYVLKKPKYNNLHLWKLRNISWLQNPKQASILIFGKSRSQ